MPSSNERLLAIARNYWRSDKDHHFKLELSPEAQRLQQLWEQKLAQEGRWEVLLDRLEASLPDFTIGDATATCDAAFRCAVYPPRGESLPRFRWVVVGCISILAPVYSVYGVRYEYSGATRVGEQLYLASLLPEMQAPADLVGRAIEEVFGYSALPYEIAETPIPLFVEPREPPQTTLFHALFTSQPERVP
ncbi:hypothetical protein ACLESD_39120 [Pyxidicoccus sp. 3LFB2]